jgi:hypothetical protein
MALSYPKWTAQFKPSFFLDSASVDSPCQGKHLLRRFHHGDVHHGALIGHRCGPVTFRLLHGCQETLIVGNFGSVSKVEMDCDCCHTGPHPRSLS